MSWIIRVAVELVAFAAIVTAQPVQDPARLEVAAAGGSLSYELINLSPYRIVGFEVYTQFTSGGFENLGCFVNAEVKSPKDLALAGVCQLPRDTKTGKPVNYSSRIVRVNFENGLTWTPGKSSKDEKR
ncbi:MAG: hypothetical protein ABSH00_15235 [Bryobacteraceae bacterium]|jgi:hypothetical protein